ncbi:hypothetical protein F5Y16DRAFT_413018 [Xylariaceae sp. FL0255]|nr:hypothetical protein F5Y16DRAFT_413018 [Xylariaceae sp. FL0255]
MRVKNYIIRHISSWTFKLLLFKLELELDRINKKETNVLHLSSYKNNDNIKKGLVLSNIKEALTNYKRCYRIFKLKPAKLRSVLNLQHWINRNGCVARAEIAYLKCFEELVGIVETNDTVMLWLETLVEDCLIQARRFFRMKNRFGVLRDINIYIPAKSLVARLARVLMTLVIIILLLAPIFACSWISSTAAQIGTIIVATTLFVIVLSTSTKAKTIELVIAGATYTTVLTVFITSVNMSQS